MPTRIIATARRGGGTDTIQRPLTADEQKRLDGLMGDETSDIAPVSRARQKLLSLTKGAQAKPVETVQIGGESWFIRRGGLGKLATVNAWMGRDETGALDITDEPDERADKFAAAALLVYVENEDGSPFFSSLAESLEWARSTDDDVMELVGALLNHVIATNPRLDPEYVKPTPEEKKAAQEAEKKSESAEPQSAPNGTPSTTSPPSTLNTTPSTAAPATWQSDVGCSTSTSLATREPSSA